jgi:hypothetical protein
MSLLSMSKMDIAEIAVQRYRALTREAMSHRGADERRLLFVVSGVVVDTE